MDDARKQRIIEMGRAVEADLATHQSRVDKLKDAYNAKRAQYQAGQISKEQFADIQAKAKKIKDDYDLAKKKHDDLHARAPWLKEALNGPLDDDMDDIFGDVYNSSGATPQRETGMSANGSLSQATADPVYSPPAPQPTPVYSPPAPQPAYAQPAANQPLFDDEPAADPRRDEQGNLKMNLVNSTDQQAPQLFSKKLIFLGGGAVLLIVIIGLYTFLAGGKADNQAIQQTSTTSDKALALDGQKFSNVTQLNLVAEALNPAFLNPDGKHPEATQNIESQVEYATTDAGIASHVLVATYKTSAQADTAMASAKSFTVNAKNTYKNAAFEKIYVGSGPNPCAQQAVAQIGRSIIYSNSGPVKCSGKAAPTLVQAYSARQTMILNAIAKQA